MRFTCLVCKGSSFSEGRLATSEPREVKYRERTSLITSDYTEVRAFMCRGCGYVMVFGEIGEYLEEPEV